VTSVQGIKQPYYSPEHFVLTTTAISVKKFSMLWCAHSRRFKIFGACWFTFMCYALCETPTVYWWVGKSNLNTVWGLSLQNRQ